MDVRRTPRTPIACPITLLRRRGGPVAGRTEDLAPAGARVVVDRPLAIDEELELDLTCPGGDHVACRARVVRQQRPDCYALRFEALDAPSLELLNGVLSTTQ